MTGDLVEGPRPGRGVVRAPAGSPVVDRGAVGFVSPTWRRSWTSDDLLLYALAVGARAEELALVSENSDGVRQRAVPSFAALVGGVGPGVREAVGPAWDPVRLVYASQGIRWHRELPVAGAALLATRVAGLEAKTSGVLVHVETDAVDEDDAAPLFTSHRSVFLRGATVSPVTAAAPRSAPDPSGALGESHLIRHRLAENQALLYRLTGDRHPLHSDPSFARRAGFDRPILHGLCTYGVATMLLLRHVADGDPSRLRGLSCRFRAPVWPGDELELAHDDPTEGRVRFEVRRRTDHRVVIGSGRLDVTAPRVAEPAVPQPRGDLV